MKHSLKTLTREYALKFLYLCDMEQTIEFSERLFRSFVADFKVPENILNPLQEMISGTMKNLAKADELIVSESANWKLHRMASTDRAVLRLATYELLESQVPTKVVLNEAIDIAKKYGTEGSGSFVNGVLDAIAKRLAGHSKGGVGEGLNTPAS